MDHAAYDAFGARFHFEQLGGIVKHEFNLFAEQVYLPIGDWTPAYEGTINTPLLQVGAGVAFNRFLSTSPSLAEPRNLDNTFIQVDYAEIPRGTRVDTIPNYIGPFSAAPNPIPGRIRAKDTAVHYKVLHRWTQRGIKLMGRASLDFGFLLPSSMRSPEDLKIFGEIAVLGWKNQPFFYENRAHRTPIMAGLNLPTFKALDLLSVQAEYYQAKFNSIRKFNDNSLPVWEVQNLAAYDPGDYKRDDWKWSLYAKKSFSKIVTVHAQAANDHMRLRTFDFVPNATPVTQAPNHWHYLIRLECGI